MPAVGIANLLNGIGLRTLYSKIKSGMNIGRCMSRLSPRLNHGYAPSRQNT